MAAKPKIALPQNWLDKAIAYAAPGIAVRRGQARAMLALAGGYTGARRDRAQLAGWHTRPGSPDSDISPDLPALRARSRDLARNAPVATGAIHTTVASVVGTGLSCNPQIDAQHLGLSEDQAAAWHANARRRFKGWAESLDCSLSRDLNFYGVQALAFCSTLESGDCFVSMPRANGAGRMPRMALQVTEADRISTPHGKVGQATLVDGIEYSPITGEAVAYFVAKHHPGDQGSARTEWQRVDARGAKTGRRNVLHLYRATRPGQRRGVPMLAPVIEPLKQLARYTDAELSAAVVSGLFSVFLRMDPEAFNSIFADENDRDAYMAGAKNWSGELEGSKAINLLPGEEPVAVNPGRPNAQFDPFVQSILMQIGMSLGLPFEVLTQRFQSSYSAARGALLQAWKFFMVQRDWLATNLCQPVYETWLAEEIAEGRIAAPGFFADPLTRHAWSACLWVGDGPGSLDPGKEVKAAAERVALGTSTLQAESILHDGVDWETKHAQTVKEATARRAAGLAVQGAEPPAPPPPAAPQEPEPPATEPDANTSAIAAALHAMAATERQPTVVHVPATPVTLTQTGDTHLHLAAGAVQNTVQPAPVVIQQQATRQRFSHREDGEITEIITEPYLPAALN